MYLSPTLPFPLGMGGGGVGGEVPETITRSLNPRKQRALSIVYTTSSPHFSSGTVERAKRERAWKSPYARKGDT